MWTAIVLSALQPAEIHRATGRGSEHSRGVVAAADNAVLDDVADRPGVLDVLQRVLREDIKHTRSIRYVVKNGVVYSGDDAARVFPNPRPAGAMYKYGVPTAQ